MIDRGLRVEAIHFSLEPITDRTSSDKSLKIARILGLDRLTLIVVGEAFAGIAKACRRRFYFVLSKRFIVRVAERVARETGCRFLITGENLGQVSSQTLTNLGVIDAAATIPVLRPLIGFDKVDIVRRAKAVGTYEVSEGPEICDLLGPAHPATAARLEDVLAEEAKLDLAGLADAVLKGRRVEAWEPGTPQ